MTNGISCYTGLNVSPEENIALIEKAADLGLKRLFTSALIPEATQSVKFFEDFTNVLVTAVTKDFEIILDVNPDNYENFDFEGLTLRLDDGFTPEEIATLSNSRKILINASTVTKNFLQTLKTSPHCTIFIRIRLPDSTHIFLRIGMKFSRVTEWKSERSSQAGAGENDLRFVKDFRLWRTAEIFRLTFPQGFWRRWERIL